MTTDTIFYTPDLIDNLQYRYGEGYLSPGGLSELRLMFDGVPVAGRSVLDVGCGIGGYDVALVRALGAAHVTGTDIEAGVLARARERPKAVGLEDHFRFIHVDPGPLPFEDASFDVVFSKDAIVHMPDKADMLGEMWRVLVPGGILVLGDWFGSDAPMTPEMRAWATEGDETFAMDSLSRMADHAQAAGFTNIATRDRADWFCAFCRDEVARLEGPLFRTYASRFGEAQAHRSVANAKARRTIAEQGQLRPGHLRARKPA